MQSAKSQSGDLGPVVSICEHLITSLIQFLCIFDILNSVDMC